MSTEDVTKQVQELKNLAKAAVAPEVRQEFRNRAAELYRLTRGAPRGVSPSRPIQPL